MKVGFGISEMTSGRYCTRFFLKSLLYINHNAFSMPGADIVVGQVQNGVGSVTDYWSAAFAMPEVDACQVCRLD